jgi:hypothetical protein
MDPLLLGLMPATIQWYPKTGFDQYSKRTFSATATVIPGRLGSARGVGKSTGSQVDTVTATFWCGGVYAIAAQDRIVLPDGTSPDIVKVETVHDENGPHHTKLTLAES